MNAWVSKFKIISLKILVVGGITIGMIFAFINTKNDGIYVNGSTTVQPLMLSLGQYYSEFDNQNVNVSGGGSTQGIRFLLDSLTDIGASSRYPSAEEYGLPLWQNHFATFPIALDTIVFVVNLRLNDNQKINLTPNDILKVYSGEYATWNQIDSSLPNNNITPINREEGSGTRDAFYNALNFYTNSSEKGDKFPRNGLVGTSNGQVVQELLAQRNTIGYVSLGYIRNFFNSDKNTKVDTDIYFPNIISSDDNTNIIIPGEDLINSTTETITNFAKKVAQKIQPINDSPTNKNKNAFWHPMNLMVNLTNRIISDIFDTNNSESTALINWIYNPNTKIKDPNGAEQSLTGEILKSGYLPMYFNWINGESPFFFTPGDSFPASSPGNNFTKWFDTMKNNDYNRVSGNSEWWIKWFGEGVYK